MKKLYSTPTQSRCDCGECRPESQIANYWILALTIVFVGLVFLFSR